MNEKEFDIQIRNLLQNAEESVSPEVWEGVRAQLEAKPRVVPLFWRWSGAVAAVAAVVVAAVFLFRPGGQDIHSNPTISIAEVPEATVPVVEEPATEHLFPEVKEQVAPRSSQIAYVPSGTPIAVPEQEVVLPEEQSAAPVRSASEVRAIGPDTAQHADVDDNSLLNRLAFSEKEKASGRGFSLLASGNIQGNERGEVGPAGGMRRYSAPPLGAGEGVYNESPETSFRLPFSVGLGFKYNFTSRWAVGTGIQYTNLGRTFVGDYISAEGFAIPATDIDNQQHWLGIPLNAYYDIVKRGRWRVHAFAGGAAEFLIDNDFLIHNSPKDVHFHSRGQVPQWSIDGGLGVEFKITPVVGIFLDPSVRYYFNTEAQPRSLRTIQPLRFDLEAGVRFSFGGR